MQSKLEARPATLDEIGISTGTDKCSLKHDYLRHYEAAFAPYRGQRINFLEIGILGGSSLRMWEKFFSRARIVGIDINKRCLDYKTKRTEVEIGSQADLSFLDEIATKYPPTIVIDDGSHRADHVRITFEALFPRLLPGGIYAIEDVYFHLGPNPEKWRGDATLLPHQYLGIIAEYLAGKGIAKRADLGIPVDILETIDHIVLLPRAVLIHKRTSTTLGEDAFQRMMELARVADDGLNWFRLGGFLLANHGPHELAEEAARRAAELRPQDWRMHRLLARVLEAKDDVSGAADALGRAYDSSNGRDRDRIERDRERLRERVPA